MQGSHGNEAEGYVLYLSWPMTYLRFMHSTTMVIAAVSIGAAAQEVCDCQNTVQFWFIQKHR